MTTAVQTNGVMFENLETLSEETLVTRQTEENYTIGSMILHPDHTYTVTVTGYSTYSNYYQWVGDPSNDLGPLYTYVDARRETLLKPFDPPVNLVDWQSGWRPGYSSIDFYWDVVDPSNQCPKLWDGAANIELTFNEEFNMEHVYTASFTGKSGVLGLHWERPMQQWDPLWADYDPPESEITFVVTDTLGGRVFVFDVAFEKDGGGIQVNGVSHG